MYEGTDGLVISPTDLTKHLACPHVTTLDLAVARGEIPASSKTDAALELIFRLGLDHERAYLERLRAAGKQIVEIDPEGTIDDQSRATVEAMRSGAEVIYQAAFLHEGHRGHADFLLREDRPSLLGGHSYDIADTKLARRVKVAALLQMADYGRHLERLQGSPPERLTVVTGAREDDSEVRGKEARYRYRDVAAYARRVTAALREAIDHPATTTAQPVAHCAQCTWSPRCTKEWRDADHLSLVAFMRTDHRLALEAAGITTVRELATADPGQPVPGLGPASWERLRAQAALQIKERETQDPCYELLPTPDGRGLHALPARSRGDVYLDFEGDPYAEDGDGREYLAGLWTRESEYVAYWAHTHGEERALAGDLLADLAGRAEADPDMHIYHYAPYEITALRRLTQRHEVGEIDLDRLLRSERFVDLYAVVRQGLRVSKESYSLKSLEAFYWGHERGKGESDEVTSALDSVVEYERWLAEGRTDATILERIASYNREDVRSTEALHRWLVERLEESIAITGYPVPVTIAIDLPVATQEELDEQALAEELVAAGHNILAGLVQWHRRELRPQWWDYFRFEDLTNEELTRDSAAIGELGPPHNPRELPPPARSVIWRYKFPPQDTKVSSTAHDVDPPRAGIGTVVGIDPGQGWIDLKIGRTREPATPRGIGPQPPVMSNEQQLSIQRTARSVLGGGRPLGQLLVERVVPADLSRREDESASDAVVRVSRGLRHGVLAVQGPPGSGKTTAGAAAIGAMLDAGLRVGITALSHAVIGNLLSRVGRRALQKCDEDDFCGAPGVDRTSDNGAIVTALASGTHQLVAGTAWLWSRADLAGMVDVLVIDEAGQFSLADAVAVSQCASGLLLLGDPQQLASPSTAVHPPGAGVSVLEHMLDGAATIPADRGIFLDETWRMHPSITRVVSSLMYDDRLGSVEACGHQRLVAPAPYGGAGLLWCPVRHEANSAASIEEARVVAKIMDDLMGTSWVDPNGAVRPIDVGDILVVAPYNAHVGLLRRTLPAGAEIGTVDKFQGKEKPVVIYTMASSSADDAPRGVGFLYDLHRLNVAISRARCRAIIVGSPSLLDAPVHTPEQLRCVNALITVIEAADTINA